jgi:Flp pilus assembly protein TadD
MMVEWAVFESALAAETTGSRTTSLASLEKLARSHPESALFVTTWARALAAAERHREALMIYREAASRWPRDAALAHDRAVSARHIGATSEALAAEQTALEIDPSNALAHNGLGLLLSDAGRPSDARASFERASALDPTNASYLVNLGNAASQSGDTPAAERAFRAALALDDGDVDALNGLAVLLVQAGRPRDAVVMLERAVQLDPSFGEARLNLGIARQEAGDLAGARSAYEDVLRSPARFAGQQRAARALPARLK